MLALMIVAIVTGILLYRGRILVAILYLIGMFMVSSVLEETNLSKDTAGGLEALIAAISLLVLGKGRRQ